jgi:hypothetical protein
LRLFVLICLFGLGYTLGFAQSQAYELDLAGVYKGKTLFVQNPYNLVTKKFCVTDVLVNNEKQRINPNLSAIKIDFDGFDLNTPVQIRVLYSDSACRPVIINPDAILFHTIFRFNDVTLTDSALVWSTKGERGMGTFIVEKLSGGIWRKEAEIEALGIYEAANYRYFPEFEEGPNKFRIRYNFPAGSRISHLYSFDAEYDFYPDPVEFSPKSVKTILYFSRFTPFEIYDANNNLVYEGKGKEIDLRMILRRGRYTILFDGKNPGTFFKE